MIGLPDAVADRDDCGRKEGLSSKRKPLAFASGRSGNAAATSGRLLFRRAAKMRRRASGRRNTARIPWIGLPSARTSQPLRSNFLAENATRNRSIESKQIRFRSHVGCHEALCRQRSRPLPRVLYARREREPEELVVYRQVRIVVGILLDGFAPFRLHEIAFGIEPPIFR